MMLGNLSENAVLADVSSSLQLVTHFSATVWPKRGKQLRHVEETCSACSKQLDKPAIVKKSDDMMPWHALGRPKSAKRLPMKLSSLFLPKFAMAGRAPAPKRPPMPSFMAEPKRPLMPSFTLPSSFSGRVPKESNMPSKASILPFRSSSVQTASAVVWLAKVEFSNRNFDHRLPSSTINATPKGTSLLSISFRRLCFGRRATGFGDWAVMTCWTSPCESRPSGTEAGPAAAPTARSKAAPLSTAIGNGPGRQDGSVS
mmetsp:Transcript_23031/g.52768  ORF Transcript_23031/g.52768 Transcript_23031/m.52768 type:complete len:257 (+) Transcript_23031:406-1176(+)